MKHINKSVFSVFVVCSAIIFSGIANATCEVVWVDHDYNLATPAVKKQICDSAWDIPAIDDYSIRPIQTPQIKPIETFVIPPIGTSRCRNESIYDNDVWDTKQLCD